MEDVVIVDGAGMAVSTISFVDTGSGGDRAQALLPGDLESQRIGIITQPSVASVAADVGASFRARGAAVTTVEIPDREEAKTLAVAERCFLALNDIGLTRDDVVVGVGGGAATDLAGFVAATYLRGVRCILLPTTMLAAVDAAIGGKTAVNVGGKNLVGAFHHPDRIVIDLRILRQLPMELLREGSAEAVKAGFIADPVLVSLFAAQGLEADLEQVIARAVRVKADIVASDFTEQGIRGTLNFGHTVGHAVETLSGLSHGHSVAIGMAAASYASAKVLRFSESSVVVEVLQKLGLPTVAPVGLVRREVLDLMHLDKKRNRDGIRMALLPRIGECAVMPVDDATVQVALTAIGIAT